MDCNICAESKTNFVTCSSCNTKVCCTCVKSFLLTQLTARCMQCNAVWSEAFVRKSLPLEWVEGEYKNHCKNILLDLELSYIPSTMDFIPIYKNYHDIVSEMSNFNENEYPLSKVYKKEILQTRDFIKTLDKKEDKTIISDLKDDCKILEKRIANISAKSLDLKIRYAHCKNDYERTPSADDEEKKSSQSEESKHVFSIPCGETECKGYLDSQFACKICSTKYCKKCRAKDSQSHICRKEDIDSLEYIKLLTRPCPKCRAPINKSSGCDHMFCTHCKTSFAWKTMKIINHEQSSNPLLWQWVSAGGEGTQVVRDRFATERRIINFNDIITIEDFHYNFDPNPDHENYAQWLKFLKMLKTRSSYSVFQTLWLNNILSNSKIQINTTLREIDYMLNKIVNTYSSELNKKLRCKYILNQIDKKMFSMLAMKAYKQLQYKNEVALLLQNLRTNLSDIIKKLIIDMRDLFHSPLYLDLSKNSSSVALSLLSKKHEQQQQELEKLIQFDQKKYITLLASFNNDVNILTKQFGYTQIDFTWSFNMSYKFDVGHGRGLSDIKWSPIQNEDDVEHINNNHSVHFVSHKTW